MLSRRPSGRTSHTRSVPSGLVLRTWEPSGLELTKPTLSVWPRSDTTSRPVVASHTRGAASSPPVTTSSPSTLKLMEQELLWCPLKAPTSAARSCDENIVAFSRDANERTVGAPGRITGTVALGSGAESPGEQSRTVEQQTLIDFGLSRFDPQGLELSDVETVSTTRLSPVADERACTGRRVRSWRCARLTKPRCFTNSHAWANRHLTAEKMEAFVAWRGLDSWNDHDDAWERRGTEHVAETIAWALLDDPNHVKWVETQPDGSQTATHLILTLGLDVDVLLENLTKITGQDPVFRHAGEWSIIDETPGHSSEFAKLGW